MSETLLAAENTVRIVGDAATLALTIGKDALPIIQFVAGFVPGAAPAVQVLSVAIPILQQIATYAPQVQVALAQGSSLSDAVVGIGEALLMPIRDLMKSAGINPDVVALEVFLAGSFKRSEFSPQDPRFDRLGAGTQS